MKTELPIVINEDSVRPFRLWDANARKALPGRNYGTEEAALNGAVVLMYWAKVKESIEVVDVRTARLVKQFTRRVDGVEHFTPTRLRRAA